jgi:hypothetical protein
MIPTLRFQRIDLDQKAVDGNRGEASGRTAREPSVFPEGTPLPRRAVEQIEASQADDSQADEPPQFAAGTGDHDVTHPVDRMDPDDIIMTTPVVRFDAEEIGTRTLMGIMPRSIRATAKSGWVEAGAATEPAKPHAEARRSQQIPEPLSSRAGEIVDHFRPDQRIEIMARRAETQQPLVEVEASVEHWTDWSQLIPTQRPRSNRADKVLAKSYRVLGFTALAAIVLVLGAYIATTAFYFFSTSWIAPAVITATDEKVVALKAELATQESHRARLAGELGDLDKSIAALGTKRDDAAAKQELAKVTTARKSAQAALERQDEIIHGIQQSAYLRATSEKQTTALVPYENLKGVKPGTKVYGCAFQMVWCRQVGSVLEVLPGEITFKHPKRDATMRGQLVQLQMVVPEAASSSVLFLGGAPFLL